MSALAATGAPGSGTDELRLPRAKELREVLEGLLGRDVELGDGLRVGDGRGLVALYVDERLRLRALVALDLRLAAVAGAAIGLLPPGRVADAVQERALDTVLSENATEVCNVLTPLFVTAGSPRLRLYRTHAGGGARTGAGGALPGDVAALLAGRSGRADWSVAVRGYPTGQASFLLV